MNGHLSGLALVLALGTGIAAAYPLDGYEDTGIRRLLAPGSSLPPGARLNTAQVHISGVNGLPLPATDGALSSALRDALGEQAPNYGVAVLDLSDPADPRFFGHQTDYSANVGSVGKVLVLLAWLQHLADLYPDDVAARARVLREVEVVADDYIVHNEHKVPIYQPASGTNLSRRLAVGDRGNLWEFLDWMLSASSNGAAAIAMKELVAARHLGQDYLARTQTERDRALEQLGAGARGRLLIDALLPPVTRSGLDPNRIRQGSLFTYTGKARMPGTSSIATPRDLVRLLALIEAGKFVDVWSSNEAKRLLYMTQRRIRYASHPVLNPAAVYFKSGSLYSCAPEPGFVCRKYMGNKVNRLASIALVEYPAQAPTLRYAVAVMSNVLRQNSAVAHQTLALRIHRLIEARHADRLKAAGQAPMARDLPPATLEAAEGRGSDD